MDDEEYNDRFIIMSEGDEGGEGDESISRDFSVRCALSEPCQGEGYHKSVMSIDIGVIHLGISVSLVDKNYDIIEVIWINLIDITKFDCLKDCELYHDKTFCDWVSHLFEKEKEFFERVDVILIERQPPMGFTVVEQLIFYKWRDKSVLISPNSVHKYFNMGRADYEQRKKLSEKIINIKSISPELKEQFGFYTRIHDITDSILFTLFWCHQNKLKKENRKLKRKYRRALKKQVLGKPLTMEDFFDRYGCVRKSYNYT